MNAAEFEQRGTELTQRILQALAPIVDGQPSEIVIQAMAGAMWATLAVAVPNSEERVAVMHRYADRLLALARPS